ncbi:hypothetical protein [Micromonospora sp. S-DT3-3-22]|uniref:hypothetical protein n=1 Tax=Micromonospora sp. S-DT3-3-22 TaxID=2755359 RepID=UPI00188E4292|nr:hypothetical protein [Micromonospora sp. S-DT3-3-22]
MYSHSIGKTGKRTVLRRLTGAAAVIAAMVTVNTLGAGPALAAGPYIGSNSGGAWLRSAAYLGDQYKVRYVNNNTAVTMVCWVDTQWVYPPDSDYASNRWFKVDVPSVGVYKAYVHSSLVESQVGVGRC